MARKGRRPPRRQEPLPPPLPPEERSVGQLVAETIRFYQHHFFQTIPLGLSVAALTQLTVSFGDHRKEPYGHPPSRDFDTAHSILGGGVEVTILLGALLLTASYIVAIVLVTGRRPQGRAIATAYGLGVLVFLPVPLLAQLLVLPAVAYLAFFGWVVPAALIERTGIGSSFRRAAQLARVDYIHAAGGLATLVIVFYVVRLMLAFLLRSGGESTERVAALLADLVLSPMLFVGSAILYLDQAARVRVRSSKLEAPTQEA
jgi:ABC-type amino acid transport system permease subunit